MCTKKALKFYLKNFNAKAGIKMLLKSTPELELMSTISSRISVTSRSFAFKFQVSFFRRKDFKFFFMRPSLHLFVYVIVKKCNGEDEASSGVLSSSPIVAKESLAKLSNKLLQMLGLLKLRQTEILKIFRQHNN